MKKICIVGMGNMGSAIHEALKVNEDFDVAGCDKDDEVNECLNNCDVFIIAVKPQSFNDLSGSISVDLSKKLGISIMAGMSIEKLKIGLKTEKIVRVMPNLPLKAGKALSGWICSTAVNDEEREFTRGILNSFGTEIELDEEGKIDAITALSGSGPAYFYYLAEIMTDAALKYGFSAEQAKKIAENTFFGSAELAEKLKEDVKNLREKVTSKGGTTEAAINHLRENQFDEIFQAAIEAAYKRAKKLNNN